MKFKVIALTVSGFNKKIHRNGDEVTEKDFPPGRAAELVKKEFLKEIPEAEAPADDEEAKKKAEFEAAIKDGDDALSANNYDLAIVAYKIALELNFDNDAANTKLVEAEKAKNADVANPDLKKEVVANPAILEELANDNKNKTTTTRKK